MKLRVLVALLALAAPTAADETHVLGHFTTGYADDAAHKARAGNVQLAAEAIDRKTIAPGATFSFNDAVGERTAAFGFAKATVLRDGMLAEGMGGGTCQVASTLHAAALLGGLEIVARAPHSWPSAYIRMGLDATVAFGSIDLKIKNPTSELVTIRARANKGSLVVALESAAPVPKVTLVSEIVERTPFENRYERDKAITDDKIHVHAFGIPGFRIRRLRTVDGRRDVRFDTYAPVTAVLRVGQLGDAGTSSEEDGASVVEAEAEKPALVQVRPSTIVTLENTP
jgi:hypothetical protein